MNSLGNRLKLLRDEKNMTMKNLADALGLNNSGTVNNWEKGTRIPKEEYLQSYANYFNVPVDWIKYGDFDEFCKEVLTYAIETDIPHPLYMELKRLLDITAQRYTINEEIKEDTQTRLETFKKVYGDSLIKKIKEKGIVYDEDGILQTAVDIITDTLNSKGGELAYTTIQNLKTMRTTAKRMMENEDSSEKRKALEEIASNITVLLNSFDKLN